MTVPTHRIGNVELVALRDAELQVPAADLFPSIAADDWKPYRDLLDTEGRLHLTVGCFAARAAHRLVIVDTGIGNKPRTAAPLGNLWGHLEEDGVRPDEVTDVIISHMHFDHCGWNTLQSGDFWRPAFPKARYHVSRVDWEYWTRPQALAANPHITDCFLPLEAAGVLDLHAGEYRVGEELTVFPTPGHTPGHCSVWITSAGQHGLILGDVAHSPVQVRNPGWSTSFDTDPARAAETRRQVLERARSMKAQVIAGHFPYPAFGVLEVKDGKAFWKSLL